MPDPGNPQALNRYAYVYNNPLRYSDPSGHWAETVWDIANIVWDIGEIRKDPGNLWNWGALAVDVGAVLLPGVPAGAGLVARGGKAAARADDAIHLAKTAAHLDDAAKLASHVDEAAELVGHADEAVAAAREAKNIVEPKLLAFTRRNFRENLMRLTGETSEDIVGLEAHHVLPVKFEYDFAQIGINVHDPHFGAWVEAPAHRC